MTEIKKYKMLINGNWTSGSENKFFESLNPYTGAVSYTQLRANETKKDLVFPNML